MIIDSQSHCHIEYLPEIKCIIQTWRGYAGSQKFREALEKTIAFSQANEVHSIISDTREQKIVAMEDIEWLATVGNPQLFKAGVHKLAFISPKDPFTGQGENAYAQRSKGQVEVQWFAELERAKTWVKEQS